MFQYLDQIYTHPALALSFNWKYFMSVSGMDLGEEQIFCQIPKVMLSDQGHFKECHDNAQSV